MEKFLNKVIWILIAAPAIYLGITWNKIPATVPLHFNLKGEVDKFGSKTGLILETSILIALSLVIYIFLPQVYKLDSRKYAADNKARLHRIAFCISVFISAVSALLIYSTVKGNIESGMRFIMAGAGLLIAVAGNYIYTIKPNYFAGIRLPWTLRSDENWRRTHLLAGKIFFAGGLIVAVSSLFTPLMVSIIILPVFMLIAAVIIGSYSFRLNKQLQNNL